tara:strand:+ start:2994 stop:3560 length:567 start_codon:yes stop_codon:yes gene_type:complete
MKKHNFDKNTHIQGYYIPNKICDNLITFFNKKKHRQIIGTTGYGVRKDVKDSIDIGLSYFDSALDDYNVHLQKCVSEYEKTYIGLVGAGRYVPYKEEVNIQFYKPGGGFKKWHFERTIHNQDRLLVFMTYLNDVPNGGTEFFYQKTTSPAKKGLTIIWPAEFTHLHRGQIAKHDKYIVTGWYTFENKK